MSPEYMTLDQGVLFIVALVGSVLRSWAATGQATWSVRSIGDWVVGGVAGLIAPIVMDHVFPPEVNLAVRAGIMFVGAYTSSSLTNNLLVKLGRGLDPTALHGER